MFLGGEIPARPVSERVKPFRGGFYIVVPTFLLDYSLLERGTGFPERSPSHFPRAVRAIGTVAVWFLQRMEGSVQTEVGPLRPSELLSLVRKGEIKPETRLRKDNSAWFPASDVGGLFEAAIRQELHYFCPACGQQIGQPPRTCPRCLRDVGKSEARVVKPEEVRGEIAIHGQAEETQAAENSVQSWLKKKVTKKNKK